MKRGPMRLPAETIGSGISPHKGCSRTGGLDDGQLRRGAYNSQISADPGLGWRDGDSTKSHRAPMLQITKKFWREGAHQVAAMMPIKVADRGGGTRPAVARRLPQRQASPRGATKVAGGGSRRGGSSPDPTKNQGVST
jgi:hypothetical protein